MIDDYDHVYIERQGEQDQFENVTRSFQDEQHLLDGTRKITRISEAVGMKGDVIVPMGLFSGA